MKYGNALALALSVLITGPCLLHAESGSFVLAVKKTGTDVSKIPDSVGHIARDQSMTIQINVRNLAKTNASIRVHWYFIAKKSDTGDSIIFDQGEKAFDLKPSASTNEIVKSGMLHMNAPEHINPRLDAKMDGYLVVGTDAAGNSRCEATRTPLKDLVKTALAFEALKKRTQAWKDAGGNSIVQE